MAAFYERGNEPSSSIKYGEYLDSQGGGRIGICCVELVAHSILVLDSRDWYPFREKVHHIALLNQVPVCYG